MPEEHQPVRLTLRWTQQTKDALDAYARAKGLSLSAASEQLLGEAFAARADATLHQGAAPALSDQIQRDRPGAGEGAGGDGPAVKPRGAGGVHGAPAGHRADYLRLR